MDAITYASARANPAHTLDRFCNDHEPLIMTHNDKNTVAMLSLKDYNALEEMAYVLHNPANARQLLISMAQPNAGKVTPGSLPSKAVVLG